MSSIKFTPSTGSGFEYYFFERADIPYNHTASNAAFGGAHLPTLWDGETPTAINNHFRTRVTENAGRYSYGFVLKFPRPYFIDKIVLNSAENYPLRDNTQLTFGFNYLPGRVAFIPDFTGSLTAGGSTFEGTTTAGKWIDPYTLTNPVPQFPGGSFGSPTNRSIEYNNTGTWWANAVRFLFNKEPEDGAGTAFSLNEIELWIKPNLNYNYEFNDSVLSTHSWNSSRFTGRQLSAAKINEFTAGDSSYQNTPVINNYTRTFYVLNTIQSITSGSDSNDNLLHIPKHSYLLADTAITVNKDGSTYQKSLVDFPSTPSGNAKLKGFNREFKLNFPAESQVSVKTFTNSPSVPSTIANSYNVYFNEGRLEKIYNFRPTVHFDSCSFHYEQSSSFGNFDDSHMMYMISASNPSFSAYAGGSQFNFQNISASLKYYNTALLAEISPDSDGIIANSLLSSTGYTLTITSLGNATGDSFKYKRLNPQERRFFVSFCSGSTETPILFNDSASVIGNDYSILNPNNLSYFSTTEVTSGNPREMGFPPVKQDPYNLDGNNTFFDGGVVVNTSDSQIVVSDKYQLPQDFSNVPDVGPSTMESGSYTFSILNQDKPALLVALDKEAVFPEGLGNKPIVIYPETLHPFIKDNITHYMGQLGYDLGPLKIPLLDNTNGSV